MTQQSAERESVVKSLIKARREDYRQQPTIAQKDAFLAVGLLFALYKRWITRRSRRV